MLNKVNLIKFSTKSKVLSICNNKGYAGTPTLRHTQPVNRTHIAIELLGALRLGHTFSSHQVQYTQVTRQHWEQCTNLPEGASRYAPVLLQFQQ